MILLQCTCLCMQWPFHVVDHDVVEAVDDFNIWKSPTFSGQFCKCTRASGGRQICKFCTGGGFLTQAGKRAGALNSLVRCAFDIFLCTNLHFTSIWSSKILKPLTERVAHYELYKKENISIGLKHQVRSLSTSNVYLCITRSSKANVAPIFEHSFKSTDHLDQWIIEFNRSKDLDDTAPPPPLPSLAPLFDLGS